MITRRQFLPVAAAAFAAIRASAAHILTKSRLHLQFRFFTTLVLAFPSVAEIRIGSVIGITISIHP